MSRPRVSICIPTYNGQSVLAETLESIIQQHRPGLEVVVCDDCSRDSTYELAEEYARKYPFVRAVRNEQNLGMDGNFTQSVLHGAGAYVWLSGQDDVFEAGAVEKLWDILDQHPELDLVYFNYRFVSGDLSREVADPPLKFERDQVFADAASYFSAIDHVPSFLPATVMRRDFWNNVPVEQFFGTHYVQVGVWLLNCAHASTYVVADPKYITCRIPEDSWKHSGGQMLFEIFSGALEVYERVFRAGLGVVPAALMQTKRREFLRGLPGLVVFLSEKGFRLNDLIKRRMKYLFAGRWVLYAFYVYPIIHIPPAMSAGIRYLYGQAVIRALFRAAKRAVVRFGLTLRP
jgi:glycosyltransferase involved in cell wall biosynthesis